MLPSRVHEELYRFLQGADEYASSFLEQTNPLDKDGLTNMLLSTLDSEGKAPTGLSYPASQFIANLKAICEEEEWEETFNFTLEHERFSKTTEGKITQSDFLLDLAYTETQRKEKNWRSIYYIQAKRPASFYPKPPSVDLKIPYDDDQDQRIGTLRKSIGENGLKYAVYCRSKILTAHTAATFLARLRALELYGLDQLSMENAGIWINDGAAETVSDLLWASTETSFPFAQFISMHYLDTKIDGLCRYALDDDSSEFGYLKRLAHFEESAIREVWDVTEVKGKPRKRNIAKLALHVTGPGPKPILKSTSPRP